MLSLEYTPYTQSTVPSSCCVLRCLSGSNIIALTILLFAAQSCCIITIMAMEYQVWQPSQQRELIPAFVNQIRTWSHQDLDQFMQHDLEIVRVCCDQMKTLVKSLPDVMALRRVETFCETVQGYIYDGCPAQCPDLPATSVMSSEIVWRGFRDGLMEEGCSRDRLLVLQESFKRARNVIKFHETLWQVHFLQESMEMCRSIFDDAYLTAYGLLHEPGGMFNSTRNRSR